ncbi:PREDICTED: LOW QUALITY PROTEIN: uncharacterized protein LOC105316719 [Amphimedon queenslandica]|uniref:Uncharacterized protein n=1 Tax=Amphimedon queenslandica TaxID=400682 RepID=A0AAN0IV53_AMPQE|nr:PREDICTED: LOW QUALITY PROTEIN: uncharacterized protein LOC105316719 [Amphimedon queenslandica]|eukprot:XP_019848705.1 PREDICTED: LOW QUALITY PROTEIN: uncharacterized protein LOC105316719 [Amphimedon queenslandica]
MYYILYVITHSIPLASDINGQGTYWANYYTSSNGTQSDYVASVNRLLTLQNCSVNALDLYFVMDASGSVGPDNFDLMKGFVYNITDSFNVGSDSVRVGVMSYASSNFYHFDLNTYSTKSSVLTAINDLPFSDGGTNTAEALDGMRTRGFSTSYGARPRSQGVPRVGIVITDGYSNSYSATLTAASNVHNARIIVFAIGIAGANQNELDAIASQPSYVSFVSSFSLALLNSLQFTLSQESCVASPKIELNSTVTDNIGSGQTKYLNYPLPNNTQGITVVLNVTNGSIILYASTVVSTPNEAFHEFKLVTNTYEDVFINRSSLNNSGTADTVFIAVEGNGTSNQMQISATPGDTSTEPVAIDVFVNPNIFKSYGATITVECIAHGKPQPDLNWYIGGTVVNDPNINVVNTIIDENTVKSEITISGLTSGNEGSYQCIGRNLLPNGNITSSQLFALDVSGEFCILPHNPGPCHGEYPRWFFNSSSGSCEPFLYSGCGGNINRFSSLQQCIQSCGCGNGTAMSCSTDLCETSSCEGYDNPLCEIDSCSLCNVKHFDGLRDVTNQCGICDLPKESGPCFAYFERWYYNERSGLCEKFIYGGCRGNNNNFMTLSNCLQTCAEGDKTCPGGVNNEECYSDPCLTSHCPNYEDAVCIPNHCGECSAHFYNSSGHDVTMMCNDCPPEKPAVRCFINECDHKTCPNLPPTECQLDVCGSCKAHYYLNDTEVTDICNACPADGQIFKDCGGSCERTCDDVLSQDPFICDVHYCVPGCGCPAGQVLDKSNQRCVYPDQCLCTGQCDPVPNNCSSISYDECNCTICEDCPIDGQFYAKEETNCPKTCSNRYLLCSGDKKPGCSCPEGQLIDEMKNQCVHPDDCPKVDPCTLNPQPGPCTASITRYYYNYTTETCQEFTYSGCFPNENNFLTQHDCEEKCSDCYPVCTPEYCSINRKATCSLPSSLPGSVKECPGGCNISNCGACYYSYNDLQIPPTFRGCPTHCPVSNTTVDQFCLEFWGTCIDVAFKRLYKDVPAREKIKENFRCWEHPCTS